MKLLTFFPTLSELPTIQGPVQLRILVNAGCCDPLGKSGTFAIKELASGLLRIVESIGLNFPVNAFRANSELKFVPTIRELYISIK